MPGSTIAHRLTRGTEFLGGCRVLVVYQDCCVVEDRTTEICAVKMRPGQIRALKVRSE